MGNFVPAGFFISPEHFQNAYAFSCSKVKNFCSCVFFRIFQSTYVAFCKVRYVYIVPHAGAVFCGIVTSENAEFFKFAHRHFGNIQHKIVWNIPWVLADNSAFVRAHRVKIAQNHRRKTVVRGGIIGYYAFNKKLCPAVRICAVSGFHIFFIGYRCLRSVNSCGRTENKLSATEFFHNFKKRKGGIYIVAVIGKGHFYKFSDGFISGKMDCGIYLIFLKNPAQSVFIRNVDIIKGKTFFGYFFKPFYNFWAAVAKLSAIITLYPALASSTAVWEPIYPAPPVKRIFTFFHPFTTQ